MNKLSQYKWLYLWIAAAALLTLGLILVLSSEIGQAIVLIITAIIFILSVVIRIVPLIKTLRGAAARILNIAALLLDLGAGIAIFFIIAGGSPTDYELFFPFLIGGVLFFQGLVYIIEISFLGTKAEVVKFLVHIVLITLGTVLMARFDTFTTEYFRLVLGVAFLLCFVFSTAAGIKGYNDYRKKYAAKKNEKAVANVNWAETATVTDSGKKEMDAKENAEAAGAEGMETEPPKGQSDVKEDTPEEAEKEEEKNEE